MVYSEEDDLSKLKEWLYKASKAESFGIDIQDIKLQKVKEWNNGFRVEIMNWASILERLQ